MVPKRVIVGQRLLVEHVEGGVGQAARRQRIDQVGVDQMPAARRVDQIRALGQFRQGFPVQDTGGLGGQRQQADENFGARQERRQSARPVEAQGPGNVLRGAAPPGEIEAQQGEFRHRVPAQHAQPHHPDGAFVGLAHLARPVVPYMAALLRLEGRLVAVIAQHMQQHIFRHAGGEVRIDHPRHRHLGQGGVDEQMIGAGAHRQNDFQVGQLGELADRRLPGQGVANIGRVADVGPGAHFEVGGEAGELAPPPVGALAGGDDQQGHAADRIKWR